MKDFEEIDRAKILDLLEQTSVRVMLQVIQDCKELIEGAMKRKEGVNNGKHTR